MVGCITVFCGGLCFFIGHAWMNDPRREAVDLSVNEYSKVTDHYPSTNSLPVQRCSDLSMLERCEQAVGFTANNKCKTIFL